ncbi:MULTISPECIES: hypothetical protein [Vagococcus]|uniref:Uncharacterized protein n=1 Tax=Vagococcus fluvialis bH819 TaxID=1255619 RepID=A0A1X6WM80_9ENTE|nr:MULTISPECIES: hypothetical protein [Vagococcus]SLM85342.1 hypothetical protein FM121_04540 [Vagococcus fluvialis bH819]HCM89364.1 hypothetical protein [Vagococcus sp.]
MDECENLLSEEEELELAELQKKHNGKKYIEFGLVFIILLSVVILSWGIINYAPFNYKIEGVWTEAESSTYKIENNNEKTRFEIRKIQNNPNLTLVFEGVLRPVGVNRYKTKNVQPSLEVNKKGVSNEMIEELKKIKFYQLKSDDSEKMVLNYTEEAKKEAFPNNQLEKMFYYELVPSNKKNGESQLKLRNKTFAKETILFNK